MRLNGHHGYSREPSNVPGRVNGWVSVCEGTFGALPKEARELQAQRSHHMTFLAGVALVCAWAAARE